MTVIIMMTIGNIVTAFLIMSRRGVLVKVAADPTKDKPVENIFRITDEIVHHLNQTKKMVILMIVSIVIVLPVTHIITFALIGETIFDDGGEGPRRVSTTGLVVVVVVVALQTALHLE